MFCPVPIAYVSTVSTVALGGAIIISVTERPAPTGFVGRYRAASTALPTITAEGHSTTTTLGDLVPLYVDLVFGLILPILLLLWLGHAALGVRTWPPWEVLRR